MLDKSLEMVQHLPLLRDTLEVVLKSSTDALTMLSSTSVSFTEDTNSLFRFGVSSEVFFLVFLVVRLGVLGVFFFAISSSLNPS